MILAFIENEGQIETFNWAKYSIDIFAPIEYYPHSWFQ